MGSVDVTREYSASEGPIIPQCARHGQCLDAPIDVMCTVRKAWQLDVMIGSTFFAYKQTLDVPEWMDVRRVYEFSMPLEVTHKNKA